MVLSVISRPGDYRMVDSASSKVPAAKRARYISKSTKNQFPMFPADLLLHRLAMRTTQPVASRRGTAQLVPPIILTTLARLSR